MTDEQLFAFLQSQSDLGASEKEMALQQARANQLRTQALQPSAGKDWASQLARAATGGMAGYATKQGGAAMDQYRQQRAGTMQDIGDILLKRQRNPEMVPGQYSMDNPAYG